jgi:hypothetical protein
VELGDMSQSQLRDAMNTALPGARYKPVKVPVAWARHRIAEGQKRLTELGRPEPLGVTSARDLLEPAPETVPEHPFDAEGLELSDEDAREYAKASSKLHNLPEFAGWFPPKPAVDELLAKVGQELTPGQEPDESVFKPVLEEQIDQATDRYFSPQRRATLASAMKDSALSVLSRDGEESALEVVGTMKIMEQAGLITDPPHEIPFLRGFFEKAINLLLIQGNGRLRIPMRGARPGEAPNAEPASGEAPSSAREESEENRA